MSSHNPKMPRTAKPKRPNNFPPTWLAGTRWSGRGKKRGFHGRNLLYATTIWGQLPLWDGRVVVSEDGRWLVGFDAGNQ